MTSRSIPASSAALAFGQSRTARWAASALRAADRLAPQLAARLAVDLFFMPFPTKLSARRRVPPAWRQEVLHTGQESAALLRYRPLLPVIAPPRVLLVHGWAGDALQMRPLGEALAGAGFEPVLLDLPAHGRSAGWRCSMPQIVRTLFEAQARLGPFEAVVAHSMGAVASLHAIAQGLSARRLVALAPSSSPISVLRWFGDAFDLAPGFLARMREHIELREEMAMEQFEASWFAPRMKAPVLLVHDRGDRMASFGNSEALARALPSAHLHATEGLSHRRVLADPQVIALALAHVAGSKAPAQAG